MTALVRSLAVFMLLKASPADPVAASLGPAMAQASPDQMDRIAASWGLDRPAPEQFSRWARHVLRGDLGWSATYAAPVAQVVSERYRASALLAGLAWLLSVVLGWAPLCCAGPIGAPPDQVGLSNRLRHLALPLAALTLFRVAQIALHARIKAIEILQSDHVALVRLQGARRGDILLRHVVRNAALPGVTVLFASVGEVIGGAILAEQVFAWLGLGRATVEAGMRGDVALLMAIAILTAITVFAANLTADRLAPAIGPRQTMP